MSPKSWLKSLATRLTIAYSVVLLITHLCIFSFFYYLIYQGAYDDLDRVMAMEMQEIVQAYKSSGFANAKRAILEEARDFGVKNAFFRLVDSTGSIIYSSEMGDWPAFVTDPPDAGSKVSPTPPVFFETISSGSSESHFRFASWWTATSLSSPDSHWSGKMPIWAI